MIHTFKEDFYGEILSVVVVGYIRPEKSYDSLGKILISVSLFGVMIVIYYISCISYPPFLPLLCGSSGIQESLGGIMSDSMVILTKERFQSFIV